MSGTTTGKLVTSGAVSAEQIRATAERERRKELRHELGAVSWGGFVFGVLCVGAFVHLVWISESSAQTVTPELLGVLTLGVAAALLPRLLPYVSRISAAGIEVEMAREQREGAEAARVEAEAAREEALRAARQVRLYGSYLPAETMLCTTHMVVERDEKGEWGYPVHRPLRRRLLELARRDARGMTFGEFCEALARGGWPLETPAAGPSDADRDKFNHSGAGRLLAAVRDLRNEGVLCLSEHATDPYLSVLTVQGERVSAIEEAFAGYEQQP